MIFSKYIFFYLLLCNDDVVKTQHHYVEFYTNHKAIEDNNNKASINYSYRYFIDHPESKLVFDHWEDRKDDRVTGRYGVLEPSGYIRNVYYEVDGNSGFRSIVKTRTPNSHQYQFMESEKRSQPQIPFKHLNHFCNKM